VSLEGQLAAAIRAAGAAAHSFPFEAWALRVFAHQLANNRPYRAFCERRGVTLGAVQRWDQVPPVPAAAFRHVDLSCGPPEATFRTSGTTAGGERRGHHLVPCLDLYRASALVTFERFLLPDAARLPAIFLLPPPSEHPDSSLVRMCAWVAEELSSESEWFGFAGGLDMARLLTRLREHETSGRAVLIAGPTAGFSRLFESGAVFRLGPGSRLMDTGGAKGTARPLSRAGFVRACWTHLGIAGYLCVNEYGMTELCSQRYESVLRDRFAGRSLDARRLVGPPWLRTRVLDPDTLEPVAAGDVGLLCHHDLANAGSVSAVLSEDLGRAIGGDGIEVIGRIRGAPPRGCGLLLADLAP
jgi:hypothetical protein